MSLSLFAYVFLCAYLLHFTDTCHHEFPHLWSFLHMLVSHSGCYFLGLAGIQPTSVRSSSSTQHQHKNQKQPPRTLINTVGGTVSWISVQITLSCSQALIWTQTFLLFVVLYSPVTPCKPHMAVFEKVGVWVQMSAKKLGVHWERVHQGSWNGNLKTSLFLPWNQRSIVHFCE